MFPLLLGAPLTPRENTIQMVTASSGGPQDVAHGAQPSCLTLRPVSMRKSPEHCMPLSRGSWQYSIIVAIADKTQSKYQPHTKIR